jgi:hypothetical protein
MYENAFAQNNKPIVDLSSFAVLILQLQPQVSGGAIRPNGVI